MLRRLLVLPLLALPAALAAQIAATGGPYTRADSLRGDPASPGRRWWDVSFYDLHVAVTPADSSIAGWNAITYRVTAPGGELQVDLMPPLRVDSVTEAGRRLRVRQDGNAWFVAPRRAAVGATATVTVYYHGRPHPAVRPPWDGGFSWRTDSLGRPWVVTTDQGVGASLWWPNKDTQADEPDSQRVAITLPDPMVDVSNGRLRSTTHHPDGTTTFEWFDRSPINNYAITVNAGSYTHFGDVYQGVRGPLTLDYWPIDYHVDAARRQFAQVPSMLACFEDWFGPYPWYEDGYKLVEVSHNGMEHQSAVAYGNRYANGYQGRDVSFTGLGLLFDFIIIHESAHEWWGNNITSQDLADMWVHESFANYAEGLYVECRWGKQAGADYIVGARRGIRNDRPIVPGAYGVNAQGSGDMYPKGGNMLHTIRQLVDDDVRWKGILRGLNATFWHRIVTGAEVERYIGTQAGMDLSKVFDQYLRDVRVPAFEYQVTPAGVRYRWADVVPGFDMPVRVAVDGETMRLRPTEAWQTLARPGTRTVSVDRNYYVVARAVQ